MSEHWADKEIQDLKVDRERLQDQEERKNIWRNAFIDLKSGWRLSPMIERQFRESGFDVNLTDRSEFLTSNKMSFAEEFMEFKKRLLRGACEYLEQHPTFDNKITHVDIVDVLKSHPEFSQFVSDGLVRQWLKGKVMGLMTVAEEYAIDQRIHGNERRAEKRYIEAVQTWWKEHPSARNLKIDDLAKTLNLGVSAVRIMIRKKPFLQAMIQRRSK